MQTVLRPNAEPFSLFRFNSENASAHPNFRRLFSSISYSSFREQKPVFCAIKRRKRNVCQRSSKLALESAFILASKFGLLPPPLVMLLKEFGGGNGGRNGFWNGFGWRDFDGWKRRRQMKLGVVGIAAICFLVLGFSLWKELAFDTEFLLGFSGLLLFGFSINSWRKGAIDWVLGFCCCGFLWGLMLKRDVFQTWVKRVESLKMTATRKRRVF